MCERACEGGDINLTNEVVGPLPTLNTYPQPHLSKAVVDEPSFVLLEVTRRLDPLPRSTTLSEYLHQGLPVSTRGCGGRGLG